MLCLGCSVWERPKVRDARNVVTQETETALSFIPVVQKTLSVTSVSWFSCGWGQICHWCKLVQHYLHQLTPHRFTPGDNSLRVFSATKPRGQQTWMNPKAARSYEMKELFLIVGECEGLIVGNSVSFLMTLEPSSTTVSPKEKLLLSAHPQCESIHKVVYHSESHP